MLCDNNQPEFGGESVVCTRMKFSGLERLVSVVKCICWLQLLDRCADGMAFGALNRCTECRCGHFHYK